jgi:Cu/Ag efflux protein CusF
MKAMEMPFKVADGKVLEGLKVGDNVTGKLSKENVILELRKQ